MDINDDCINQLNSLMQNGIIFQTGNVNLVSGDYVEIAHNYTNYDIMFQLIGTDDCLEKLLTIFMTNNHIKQIVYLKPNKNHGKNFFNNAVYQNIYKNPDIEYEQFDMLLSGSNGGRQLCVLTRKPIIIDLTSSPSVHSDRSVRSVHSVRSDRSARSDRSNRSDRSDRSDRSNRSDRSVRSDRSRRSKRSNSSNCRHITRTKKRRR
jgi:hypothetical protein